MLWIFLFILIAGWLSTWYARRRMGKALGRTVKESELTSLHAWNEGSEAGKKKD